MSLATLKMINTPSILGLHIFNQYGDISVPLSRHLNKKYANFLAFIHSYLREGGSPRHQMILEQSKPMDELVANRGIVELDKLAPSALAGKN